MVNLNDGKNEDLLNNCRPLKDYMTLINEIRKNCKTMEFESAVDAAVTYCIEHDVLKTFLLKHRAEVKDVCITEYNEKSFVEGIRAEGRAAVSYTHLDVYKRQDVPDLINVPKQLLSPPVTF